MLKGKLILVLIVTTESEFNEIVTNCVAFTETTVHKNCSMEYFWPCRKKRLDLRHGGSVPRRSKVVSCSMEQNGWRTDRLEQICRAPFGARQICSMEQKYAMVRFPRTANAT